MPAVTYFESFPRRRGTSIKEFGHSQVVFTECKSNSIRIISARNANKYEEARYQEAIADELGKNYVLKDKEIDTSDIPEQGKAFFKRAVLRPPESKTAVTICLDRQVLNWFKTKGPGYQTRINALRRADMEAHKS